jgi:hypothetical protein
MTSLAHGFLHHEQLEVEISNAPTFEECQKLNEAKRKWDEDNKHRNSLSTFSLSRLSNLLCARSTSSVSRLSSDCFAARSSSV